MVHNSALNVDGGLRMHYKIRYLLPSVLVVCMIGILMVPNAFAQDRGDFYLTYIPTTIYPTFEVWLKDNAFFETHVENLNNIFKLPDDVDIIIADSSYYSDCKYPNAFYSDKQILICYELIYDTDYRFTQYYEREYGYHWTTEQLLERDNATLNVVESVLYHELGHALIDVYDLPITGLEENVADQFAAYYALAFTYEDDPENYIGQNIILDTALDYWLISEEYPDIRPSAFADTHSLDKQRFYNFACWTYGAYPNYSQWMINDGWVTEERALSCEYEYQQIVQVWDMFLEQHFQNGMVSEDFDSIWILVILGIVSIAVAVLVINKNKKKTPRPVPQPKTFGVKPSEIICPICKQPNRPTSKVCGKCGNPIKGKDKPKIICPICKQPNRSTSKSLWEMW